MISRYRPVCQIVGGTTDEKVCRQLNMAWAVRPFLIKEEKDVFDLFDSAVRTAKAAGRLKAGDLVVITAGVPLGVAGNTNMIKVEAVE